MSHESDRAQPIVLASPREFFVDRVESAVKRLKFEPLALSRKYLVDLLEHFMFAKNLFTEDAEGRLRRESLAEMYLKAQNSPPAVRVDLLKKLGDSSLYISGFFGDSLTRKIVDIDYYVDMGGVAYGSLAHSTADGDMSQVFTEFSTRFPQFVDVLTFISQDTQVQSDADLLRLYNRYLATGSRLAEEQLLEKGLLNADIQKAKANKM